MLPFDQSQIVEIEMGKKYKDKVTVACINLKAVWGDKSANLKMIKRLITKAAGKGANLILFPEVALTGHDPEPKGEMHRENAETIPGPSTEEIAKLAIKYNVYIVVGMTEKEKIEPSIIYNSAAIIGPNGVLGSYQKLHLYADEQLCWSRGRKGPLVFETPWGWVGVGICYDTYQFPELARIYSIKGALLYLNPTAFPHIEEWEDGIGMYHTMLRARAMENWMFVASSNLVGREREMNFFGQSVIYGPIKAGSMDFKALAGPSSGTEEELIIAEIDLGIMDKNRKEHFPLFDPDPITGVVHRRPEMYQLICMPH
jgi:predicted amidohydrolase